MVVLDPSALIPLARIGRLDLIAASFEERATTELVRGEVVAEGQPGAAELDAFLDGVTVHATPEKARRVANLEGIAVADAAVILLADERGERLLANDKALIEVARSHGVDPWWVTTLLLHSVKSGTLTEDEGRDVLYDLVEAGMNLAPQVFAKIQRKLEEIGS